MKKMVIGVLTVLVLALLVAPVFAQADEAGSPEAEATSHKTALAYALGFGMALAAVGGAVSQSKAIVGAVEAMARQPEVAGKINTAMIIGLALIETLVIYMLLVVFVLMGKI
jgi:F-type H+-transporting ATPase subunit c